MKIQWKETVTITLTGEEAQMLALFAEFAELKSYEEADEKSTCKANDFVGSLAYSLDRKLSK